MMEPWLSGFTFAVIHHNNRNEQIESPPIITHAIGITHFIAMIAMIIVRILFQIVGHWGWTKKFQGLPRKLQAWVLLRGANPSIQMFGFIWRVPAEIFWEALCLGFT